MEVYDELLAERLRRPRARHHRGEPPGADPRQPADGALEQVRLARAHDRQQVRELGRLLDALRRHGRRLRGDQGRAEDARLPARRVAQRAGRDAAGPALDHRPPAERRAARRPEGLRLAAATTTRSTRSSRPTSRRTTTPSSSSAPGCRPTRSSAWWRSSTAPSTSAARRRPGIKITPRAFGRDRRMPITNAYRPRRRPEPRPVSCSYARRRSSSARGRTGGPRRR